MSSADKASREILLVRRDAGATLCRLASRLRWPAADRCVHVTPSAQSRLSTSSASPAGVDHLALFRRSVRLPPLFHAVGKGAGRLRFMSDMVVRRVPDRISVIAGFGLSECGSIAVSELGDSCVELVDRHGNTVTARSSSSPSRPGWSIANWRASSSRRFQVRDRLSGTAAHSRNRRPAGANELARPELTSSSTRLWVSR